MMDYDIGPILFSCISIHFVHDNLPLLLYILSLHFLNRSIKAILKHRKYMLYVIGGKRSWNGFMYALAWEIPLNVLGWFWPLSMNGLTLSEIRVNLFCVWIVQLHCFLNLLTVKIFYKIIQIQMYLFKLRTGKIAISGNFKHNSFIITTPDMTRLGPFDCCKSLVGEER